MGIKNRITNEKGVSWNIDEEGNGNVVVASHPAIGEEVIGLPYREYFKDSGGSNDMTVDGSTTPVEFCLNASQEYDTWIKSINIRLGDAGANFNEFGALPSLTNGVEVLWRSQEIGEFTIHDGIKDNLELFRLSGQTPTIIDLTGGGSDAIIVQVDFHEIFSQPYGIRLQAGTKEQVVIKIKDNISTVDSFDIIGYGINVFRA